MRFVRCESCGAKALVAASQCPKCSHPLQLRDDSGREVPLGHCKGCDTYYPLKRGGCRFCGTKATKPRLAPAAWGALAVLAVVGAAGGALRFRGGVLDKPNEAPRPLATVAASTPPAPRVDSVMLPPSMAPAATDDSLSRPVPPNAVAGAASAADSSARRTPMPTVPSRQSEAKIVPAVASAPERAPAVRPPREADVQWVPAVALTWVNVRVDPRRDSPIARVIPPDVRVELGESRSGWTHVRASGLSGWVARRLFLPDSPGHPR